MNKIVRESQVSRHGLSIFCDMPSAFEFTISSGLARSKGSLIIFYRAASTSGAAESQRSRTRGPFSNSREEFQSVPDGFTSVSEIRNTIGPKTVVKEERGEKGLGKKERTRRRRRRRRRRRKKEATTPMS